MAGSASKPRWFRVLLGRQARESLLQAPNPTYAFKLVLAASGGPRWIGLVGIDRALRTWLSRRRSAGPLPLLGASSGAWRMAAWAADNTEQAYQDLIEEYIEQRFEGSPGPAAVSAVCREYLARVFTPERIRFILENPRLQLNFSTALMTGVQPTRTSTLLTLLAATALNGLDRRLLGRSLKRVLFSALPHPEGSVLGRPWDALPTDRVGLSLENFLPAILATGSIPTVLEGESAISGSAPGHHLDGGLVDYHFEVEAPGPILYPHFSPDPIPGWMDRFPPYRRISRRARAELCLVIPSGEFMKRQKTGELPCRQDFHRFSDLERIRLWRQAVADNEALERELQLCLETDDLLRVAEVL